jgi:hypothetical protein
MVEKELEEALADAEPGAGKTLVVRFCNGLEGLMD